MYALTVNRRQGAALKYARQCEHAGCGEDALLRVELHAERDMPRVLNLCESHARVIMPGLLAIVALPL